MKRLLFTILFAFTLLLLNAQSQYSRVKLFVNQGQIQELAERGLHIDHGVIKSGVYVICELSENELAIASEAGIEFEILIEDVTKFYTERNAPFMSQLDELEKAEYALSREWPVPEGFELGTCGGFLTIDQCMEHLDAMAAQYPDLISQRASLNYETHNGRELYWVRLSDNPNMNEDEPEVLYTGMHHSREPIGMQLLVYYMYYLLENYETDPDVQYIVDNFELYFVPIISPDGYAYNIQNEPGGGGMWRKNRRQNDDGSYGVDINRNYGYMWGYDNSGSSPIPSDDTYRGPYAFSEPEIQCMKDFCEEHEFRIALNYHSYSNLLLYAWGWSEEPCEHDAIFHAYADIMTDENGYTFGPGYTTIYATNGGSDDWMYGEQGSKNMILAYTPEVGDGTVGFWPPANQIIPLCQENMYQNLMAALFAGPYAVARDLSPSIVENPSGMFFFDLQRLGLEDGATYTVSIEPVNDAIATVSAPFENSSLEILETVSAAFTYTLKNDIQSGETIEYLLSVNNGLATFSDTIRKFFGTPVVIFVDSATNFNKWTSNQWNTTTQQYHSPASSIADSPVGEYDDNENNQITLTQPIDLDGAVYASLNFWAKWDIEAGYDYVQVLISNNNGQSWTAMNGKYTHPGTSNQTFGEPVYDGTQSSWVKEEISLEQFIGDQIKIRFVLVSDTYVTGDGFFFDDMEVVVIDQATGTPDMPEPFVTHVSFYPNPASGIINFQYTLEKFYPGLNNLKIFNVTGQKVYESALKHGEDELKLDVSSWRSGIYFYNIDFDQTVISSGKLIVE